MSIGLKIIIGLVFRPKKYKFHPYLFGTDIVAMLVFSSVYL